MDHLQRPRLTQKSGANGFLVVLFGRPVHPNRHWTPEQPMRAGVDHAAEPPGGDDPPQFVASDDERFIRRQIGRGGVGAGAEVGVDAGTGIGGATAPDTGAAGLSGTAAAGPLAAGAGDTDGALLERRTRCAVIP